MKRYLGKRLLLMIPTFIGITLITYLVARYVPGDYTSMRAGFQGDIKVGSVSKEILDMERKLYGLDKPWYQGYARWIFDFVRGDMGKSRKDGRPVLERIGEALPITLALNIIAIIITYIISIPLGIVSAMKKDSTFDRVTGLGLFVLYSLPAFWVGLLLLTYLSGGDYMNLFPMGGLMSEGAETAPFWRRAGDVMWHLVLPVVTLTYGSLAFLSRYTRANMLEVINAQYITTARAKGLSEGRVVFIHAFRNSMIPLVTLMASLLPALLGGSVIVEQIFNIPGMGLLAFDAIKGRDIPVVMGIEALAALLTLAGILLADLMYAVVDPRIRLEKRL